MKLWATAAVAVLVLSLGPVAAQTQQPYAGFERRDIKALSPEQIDDLRAGRGMGLALAAELNGYPGPLHVIELADKLGLSDAQRVTMNDLFRAMKAEVIPIGEKLIAEEATLDRDFADKTITPEKLSAALDRIGRNQGALRAAHLKYHLATVDVLTAEQVHRYQELRGYAGGGHGPNRHRGHGHN